ncbi:MAG: cytochrome P450 [Gammaproteobacteria bacterium]|nr:MAG: cytochrome P450 [Gammaproteobacteria bacterium]
MAIIQDSLSSYDVASIRAYQDSHAQPNWSHVPGNDGLPFIGHLYPFLTNFHEFITSNHQKFGPVFRLRIPQADSIMLLGTEANRLVLQNENKQFSNYLAYEKPSRGLMENALLQRDFADHKYHRKILQSAFKRDALENHVALMNPIIREELKKWPTGQCTKMMLPIKNLLLHVAVEVFLGIKMGNEADQLSAAFRAFLKGLFDPLKRPEIPFMPFAKAVKGVEVMSDFIFQHIDDKRNTKSQDIFSTLCHLKTEDGSQFSDEEIKDNMIFLLFAAHDTTTSVLCSTLHSLASNPHWQETIREEILSIGQEQPTTDDLMSLTQTEWVLKEVMRLHPPLAVMARYTLMDFEYQGHLIPKDSTITLCPVFTHYMEEHWSNPQTFDPLRFAPERAEDKGDIFQYLPPIQIRFCFRLHLVHLYVWG